MEYSNEPFSLNQILQANASGHPPPSPEKVMATDGVELAVRAYRPQKGPSKAVLVFYHGGGAHSGAGYQHLSRGLCEEFGIVVYTPDLRGHGESGGPRGDSPSTEQVFRDINTVIEYVQARESPLSVPLFLGGHSSGGGLVVNYSSWSHRLPTAGYLLLSPQLGYRSGTARPTTEQPRAEFATVSVFPFLLNGVFGIMGHNKAVRFNYPAEVLTDDPGLVSWNTVNMANAITPETPQDQISNITLPLGIWVGADDELFDAEKVAAYAESVEPNAERRCGKVIPGESHLGILVPAHHHLGPWITEVASDQTTKIWA